MTTDRLPGLAALGVAAVSLGYATSLLAVAATNLRQAQERSKCPIARYAGGRRLTAGLRSCGVEPDAAGALEEPRVA